MQVYYDTITFTTSQSINAQRIYEILHKYDNRFYRESGSASIFVDNSAFSFAVDIDSGWVSFDGRRTHIDSTNKTYTTMTMIADNIVYFLCKNNDAANAPQGGFCWIKENGENYFGASTNSTIGEIDAMEFSHKTSPEDRYFSIKKHAQFQLEPPNIVFVTASIISGNDGGTFKSITGLHSCSTVPFGSTISINNNNYYAIGTNTLVKL